MKNPAFTHIPHGLLYKTIFLLGVIAFMGINSQQMFALGSSNSKDHATQPNILFIAIDDLRPELGCYGAEHIISPNIDKLAREGIVFDRAYCQMAICMASRKSIMSGYRPTAEHSLHDRGPPASLCLRPPLLCELPEPRRRVGHRPLLRNHHPGYDRHA